MLPDIVSAAYVYSTSQSVVQVTYIDATTAVVYPNQFENPRTQQLNAWVRGGGQITPFVPTPTPQPGPPAFISLAASANQTGVGYNTALNEWISLAEYNLETDGTSVQLIAYRNYEISLALVAEDYSGSGGEVFGVVDTATGDPIYSDNSGAVIIAPYATGGNFSGTPANTFLYTPTSAVSISVRCLSNTGESLTIVEGASTFTISELVSGSVYAEKMGPQGPQGVAGPTGPQGVGGPAGPQGASGPQGPAGPDGPAGPQGAPGPGFIFLGNVATVGGLPPTGNDQGDAYLVLASSDLYIWNGTSWVNAGPIQGPQGVAGVQGPQGPAGPTGPAGPAGAVGPTGATGAQGQTGPIGLTGAPGAQGVPGPTGPTGPQGLQGAQGPAGPQGPPGNSANVICRSGSAAVPANTISVPYTFDTFTLPAAATAYVINLSFGFSAQGGSAYGAMQPQVTVLNSTSGYNNTQYSLVPANFRVINYMNYPTGSTITYADSGLAAVGRLGFTFQYQGSWASGSSPVVFWQYTVTYW
jgi:hypothetical protein